MSHGVHTRGLIDIADRKERRCRCLRSAQSEISAYRWLARSHILLQSCSHVVELRIELDGHRPDVNTELENQAPGIRNNQPSFTPFTKPVPSVIQGRLVLSVCNTLRRAWFAYVNRNNARSRVSIPLCSNANAC